MCCQVIVFFFCLVIWAELQTLWQAPVPTSSHSLQPVTIIYFPLVVTHEWAIIIHLFLHCNYFFFSPQPSKTTRRLLNTVRMTVELKKAWRKHSDSSNSLRGGIITRFSEWKGGHWSEDCGKFNASWMTAPGSSPYLWSDTVGFIFFFKSALNNHCTTWNLSLTALEYYSLSHLSISPLLTGWR